MNNNNNIPVGNPIPDEKDQVKLNQQASDDPLQGSIPPPNPPTPIQPLAKSNIPLQNDKPYQNIGVGADNIGVEEKLKQSVSSPQEPAKISVSESQPAIPQSPPPNPPRNEGEIEVQTTDIPIKSYDSTKTTDEARAVPPIPPKPMIVQASSGPVSPSHGGPTATIAVFAILALFLGAGGGFLGFRYWDNLKTSAVTESSPTSTTQSPSTSTSPNDTSSWPTYSHTKYKFSLKYPTSWASSTTDPQAETIVFAENQESLSESPSGFRVEIVFQNANGKTLKSWVEANSVTTNETKPIKEVTVSGVTAYQQEQTNIRPAITTYLERPDKIMIVTLTAPPPKIGEAGSWYNSIINSIVLS